MESYGIERPGNHAHTPHQPPVRYVVLISAGGTAVARLLLASRVQVAEFDASTEEVAQMTSGLVPEKGAAGAEWDTALAGHSAAERQDADVYTLEI